MVAPKNTRLPAPERLLLIPSIIAEMVEISPLFEKLDQLWIRFASEPPEGRAAVGTEIQKLEWQLRVIYRRLRHH